MTLTVKSIKTTIIGKPVNGKNDEIAKQIETMISDKGWDVQNGPGPDILSAGIEIKSRHLNATSNQTIGSMTTASIINTPYRQSPIYKKIQKQIRVYHNGETVLKASLYDFSDEYVQSKIEEAYESARQKIASGWEKDWVPGTSWGSFEKVKGRDSHAFRLPPHAYKKLEGMSKDTFNKIFEQLS